MPLPAQRGQIQPVIGAGQRIGAAAAGRAGLLWLGMRHQFGMSRQAVSRHLAVLGDPPGWSRAGGRAAASSEVIHSRLNLTVANPAAKAVIDMAVWDVIGQSLGVPVTELLGGYGNRMRVGHMIGFGEPAEMVTEAGRIRDTYGITTFKVKVGRHPIGTDVAACRALREALGDDVELYIDGNRGWTAADSARALRAMADLDLQFAEELCPADDVLCRRWLVKQSTIPIFADESVSRPGDVTRELLGESANGISIKTARTGFSYSQRVLYQCEGLGVDVVLGNQIDGQIGSLCSLALVPHSSSPRAGPASCRTSST